ncbi:MAG: lysozyme [Pseudomonadota bacterium]
MSQSFNQPTRKPAFGAVRRLFSRAFQMNQARPYEDTNDCAAETGLETRSEAAEKHSLLDSVSSVSGVPLIGRKKRQVSATGIALIKRFEGCARLRKDGKVEAYPDPATGADPWTIGWGATGIDDQTGSAMLSGKSKEIGPETVWTQKQCDARLAKDLVRYARDVDKAIGSASTSQNQFDAMVSFHYNTGAIARATLTRKHIAGDYAGAAAEFARWNMAGGRVLKGLVRRRGEETKLYEK